MRVLVCGGRTYAAASHLTTSLDNFHAATPITLMITGGAPGADYLAHNWALKRGVPTQVFPADWNTYGRAAGPIRNAQMLRVGKPETVISFPGGPGTMNMRNQARAAGILVIHA